MCARSRCSPDGNMCPVARCRSCLPCTQHTRAVSLCNAIFEVTFPVHLADPAWYFTTLSEPYVGGAQPESGLAAALRATLNFANGYGPAQLTSAHSMPVVDPYVSPSLPPGQPSHLVVCSPLNFHSISLPGSQKYLEGCAPDYERYATLARSRRSP